MIVSWNWLKEYVRLDMPAEKLIERLLLSGINHESTSEVGGDLAIDLEITSNRPDCLGHIGIAREVAVLYDRDLKIPPTSFAESDRPIGELAHLTVETEAVAWCPRYRARVIENVKVGASPDWMRRRLEAVGLTPISNVVDITNYVLLECGQPLHAFDLDKLRGRSIVVRNARPGEKFVAINNKEYALEPWMGVIADAERAVALAGIMGGAATEVAPRTTSILLEAAEFAPIPIRRASRALDLSSDSSYRFERKVDPEGIAWASDRATHLLCELAGGRVARGYLETSQPATPRAPVTLRFSQIRRILGIDVPRPAARNYLVRLGLNPVAEEDQRATFAIPSFRRDLTREIDLVEEIGRIHGYDSVPEDRVIPLAVSEPAKADRVLDVARDTLCASGYFEAVTFTFTDERSLAAIRPWSQAEPLAVKHSIRKQENRLRQSLLPSLTEAVALNESRGNTEVQLFEIAQVFLPRAEAGLPEEPLMLGLATTAGMRTSARREERLRGARGHIEALLERLRIAAEFVPADCPGLAPGEAAEIRVRGSGTNGQGERIGVLGFASAEVLRGWDLRVDVVLAELRVHPLVDAASLVKLAAPIPDQPSSFRDLAVVVDEAVTWSAIEQLVRAIAPSETVDLESLDFLDCYRGKQVPEGKKSIALRLVYRGVGRTLTREEIDGRQEEVIAALADRLGGVLRG